MQQLMKNPRDLVTMLLTIVLSLAAVAHAGDAVVGCDKSDGAALLAVKKALGDPPGLSGWNSTLPCCAWKGVSCNATTGRVTELTIFALNISAPIPMAMANLTKLQSVNLAYNRLYGPIPSFLGPLALPGLNYLRLDGNRLTGTIPPTLTVLDLSLVGNLLVGPIPATFGAAQFNSMDLADNQLSGDASLLFGAKKQINALRLSRNQFKFDLGRVELPEPLDILVIDHNLVYGTIPPAAAARSRKWLAFDVSFNQLCGPIPQGRLTRRFGPRHFAGNKCLCARPLPPCS
ncbi:hypothetical protein QOZ80_3BG0275270 [Eleusine coracana subsp. coracana]|nr:hypothetical protein QOZ80_3BG0275270 [Eleusine coracana subsp. coracana]